MLSAFLASSAKLTRNRNKFQVSAIIISGYFLRRLHHLNLHAKWKHSCAQSSKQIFCRVKLSSIIVFCCRTRNVQQSNFSIHIHDTFDFFNTSPFFSIRTYSHPCRIPLAPLAAALTRTEHLTLLDLFCATGAL